MAMPHLRIARPVADLARTRALYRGVPGLRELDSFSDHDGFDGVMFGFPGAGWHFEFTQCRAHPLRPTPTAEDLVVFYIASASEWQDACSRLLAVGFRAASSFNPYWDAQGRTFADPDGYRIVLQLGAWDGASGAPPQTSSGVCVRDP